MENKTNDNYEDFLRGAEYRKTWSIAFFSSTNAAIELLKITKLDINGGKKGEVKTFLKEWRDWLLEEHGKYYAENIAVVGTQGFSPKVVEGLDKAKESYANTK